MPPRLEAGLLTLAALAVLWAAVSYAQHLVGNVRAGLWIGAVVDGVIWLGALWLALRLARLAQDRWR